MGEPNDAFVNELRTVLQHLYDPTRLNQSACVQLFDLGRRNNPAAALRKVLLDGIEALKPGSGIPPHSTAWRVYHVLAWRYVEQSSQSAVAANLSIGPRQLRRVEGYAIRVLADYLWKRYDLSDTTVPVAAPPENAPAEVADNNVPGVTQELAWLQDSFPNETNAISALLAAALATVAPLARATETRINYELPDELAPVTGKLAALRQALLNVLTGVIHTVPGGTVNIEVKPHYRGVEVRLWADGRTARTADTESIEHFEMARQFVCLFGGTLDVLTGGAEADVVATMVLPVVEQATILVVEDNADTLQLLARYLVGTRYRFVGARQPEQALALAEEIAPDIVLLDIMLPGIDGWELLGRLREHPKLAGVPIVVSTILPQEKLALTLGAADFIRKPFNRETLLAVLDRQQQQCESAPSP